MEEALHIETAYGSTGRGSLAASASSFCSLACRLLRKRKQGYLKKTNQTNKNFLKPISKVILQF